MNWANVRRFQLATAALYATAASANVFLQQSSGDSWMEESAQQYHFIVGFLLIAWLTSDPLIPASKRPSLDFGWFVWMTFPFFAAWLLISTRGWRGAGVLLGLVVLMLAPQIAWLIYFASSSR
jgi:hypothetical protein